MILTRWSLRDLMTLTVKQPALSGLLEAQQFGPPPLKYEMTYTNGGPPCTVRFYVAAGRLKRCVIDAQGTNTMAVETNGPTGTWVWAPSTSATALTNALAVDVVFGARWA